jgi:hypothetical protein
VFAPSRKAALTPCAGDVAGDMTLDVPLWLMRCCSRVRIYPKVAVEIREVTVTVAVMVAVLVAVRFVAAATFHDDGCRANDGAFTRSTPRWRS